MGQIFEYLRLFLDKWFFWIGIVFLVPELLKRIPPWRSWAETLPHKPFWILGGICIFVATFQTWRDEHEKVLSKSTYMDIDTMAAPRSPLPLFQANNRSRVNYGLKNGGSFLAEDSLCIAGLVVRTLDHRWNPLGDEGLPTSPQAEEEIFDQFRNENKKAFLEPRVKGTVEPGTWSFGSARTDHVLSDEEAIGLRYGDKIMYFVGLMEWRDGSGLHEKRFCKIVQPPADNAPVTLDTCIGHNDFLPVAKD